MAEIDNEPLVRAEIEKRHRERCYRIARGEVTPEQAEAEHDADWEPLVGPSGRQVAERLATWIEEHLEGVQVDRETGMVVT